jgi:hypothetical protein
VVRVEEIGDVDEDRLPLRVRLRADRERREDRVPEGAGQRLRDRLAVFRPEVGLLDVDEELLPDSLRVKTASKSGSPVATPPSRPPRPVVVVTSRKYGLSSISGFTSSQRLLALVR